MIDIFIKGGPVGCFRMAAGYAPIAFEAINSSFAEENAAAPDRPVSCTADLAYQMGASDKRIIIASGLAGGIGLCGSACGALGAAIWLNGIRRLEAGNTKIDYKNPEALALIDRFLKVTNYEFECAEIAGRGFETVADHAAYLRQGGCKKIIELLGKK